MSVIASFTDGNTKIYTKSIYQHDKGQYLEFEGIEIEKGKEVHFSNQEEDGISAAVRIEDGKKALIPDSLLLSGDYVYAWVYARSVTGSTPGEINYHIDQTDPNQDRLVIDMISSGQGLFEHGETLYQVIIPVIRRPAVLRLGSSAAGGDDSGEGGSPIQKYSVDGENLILG